MHMHAKVHAFMRAHVRGDTRIDVYVPDLRHQDAYGGEVSSGICIVRAKQLIYTRISAQGVV